jgi:hypothetical protein
MDPDETISFFRSLSESQVSCVLSSFSRLSFEMAAIPTSFNLVQSPSAEAYKTSERGGSCSRNISLLKSISECTQLDTTVQIAS